MSNKINDAFISHATEDKDDFVRKLAKLLKDLGANVWYDEFSISIGDSLCRSIEKGLQSSSFGILVLSRHFINKPWPEYELRGLTALELNSESKILPIWHNIDKLEVLAFSPILADKYALNTQKHSTEEIAIALLKVIRPDIADHILRKATYDSLIMSSKIKEVDLRELKIAPLRHESLPKSLLIRIFNIQKTLEEVFPISFEATVENFRRDMNPSREINVWENIVALYLEFKDMCSSIDERKALLMTALNISMGRPAIDPILDDVFTIDDLLRFYSSLAEK